MDTRTAYRSLLLEIGKLDSAVSLLGWDQHTHMPPRGVDARAAALGKLARLQFELSTSDELGGLLEDLEGREDLSIEERASVRVVGAEYRRKKAVPASLFEAFTVARSAAQSAWAQARQEADYERFRPHLAKLIDFARQLAELYGYEDLPYDALLAEHEPGITSRRLTEIIESLKAGLVPFLQRLLSEGTAPDASPFDGVFPVDVQRAFARRVLEAVGYDFDAGALDDAPHPFTSAFGFGDVRVTNRYRADDPLSGLYGALHEGGHALYAQGMGEEIFHLRLADGASNGIHESQSRLIENQIGRSRAFWSFIQPLLAEHFPSFAGADPDALYRGANVVRPSLIRIEADEVTYNVHIMVRFELESGLVNGTIDVDDDLPARWNDAMMRYLGVAPANDAEGLLQDIHWSMGGFGYFPSYMLGNLYAAQMMTVLRADLPDLDGRTAAGDFSGLLDWLRDKVHRLGAVYEPEDLIRRITGTGLDPAHLVDYVVDKYSEIYRLS